MRSFLHRNLIRLGCFCLLLGQVVVAQAADVSATWNGTTGDWSDSTKWDSALFPNNGNGGFTYDAIIGSGTVTLDQDIEIEGLTFGSGTITGDFDLTLNAASTWTGGTMSGSGTTTIAEGATLNVTGGNSQTLSRNLVIDGSSTWFSTANNNQWHFNNATITNNGSLTLNTTANQIFANTSGTNNFNNANTLTKIGGGTATVNIRFNNSGTVDVQEGTLALYGGGMHTGTYTGAAGTTLNLGGNHTFATGANITGPLNLSFSAGTLTTAGSVNIGGTLWLGSGGQATFNGPVAAPSLDLGGGTVNFNNSLSIPGGTISSGTLAGSANWNVTSTLNWTGGTMSGSGTTTIAEGGMLNVTGGNSQTLSRNLVIDGSSTWFSTANNNQWHFNNATITNNGNLTLNTTANQIFANTSGTNNFNNANTLTKIGGGTATVNIRFNNSGTVDVQEGTLSLQNGGTHTGDFTGATGTTLRLGGSHNFAIGSDITGALNVQFDAGVASVEGNIVTFGNLTATGGINTINGAVAVNNATFSGGTTTFNGSCEMVGLLTISGGVADLGSNSLTLSTVNLSSGSLTGSGSTTITDTLTWSGGTMSGSGTTTIAEGGMLNVTGGNSQTLSRNLVIDGSSTWFSTANNNQWHFNNATITNNGNLTLNTTANQIFANTSGTNNFNNANTLTKIGGGTATVNIRFNNSGTVDVQEGELRLHGGGNHIGTFNISSGTTLNMGSTHTFGATSQVTGPGTLEITGTTNFSGALSSTGSLLVNSGTFVLNNDTTTYGLNLVGEAWLTGSGNLTLTGVSTWTRGTMAGTGTTTIAEGGMLSIPTDASGQQGLARTLVNHGVTTLTGTGSGRWFIEDTEFQNYGTFIADSTGGTLSTQNSASTATFNNFDTFIKVGPGFAEFIPYPFAPAPMEFNNYGMVHVQEGTLRLTGSGTGDGEFIVEPGAHLELIGDNFHYSGGVSLSGGTLQLATFTLTNGTVRGTGTIEATTFTNASLVSPNDPLGDVVGAISVNGAYAQAPNGQLHIDLKGQNPGEFDTIAVTGSVTLGGKLVIDATNLASVPVGTLFPIMTAASMSGAFNNVETIGDNNIYFAIRQISNGAGSEAGSGQNDGVTAYAERLDRGDMNGDGIMDQADYDLFVFGLMNNSISKFSAKCNCNITSQQGGDFNGNGRLDFDDIAGFQNQLAGMGMSDFGLQMAFDNYTSNVPEPAAGVLVAVCGLFASLMRSWRCGRR